MYCLHYRLYTCILKRLNSPGNNWDCNDGGLDWLAMEPENGTLKRKIADYYDLVCQQQLYKGKPLHIVMDIIKVSILVPILVYVLPK